MKLRAENLNKSYNNRKVVRDVSLFVENGESVALLGPNGAGKTTCFSIIAGLVKCDSGKLFVGESEITHLPIYRRAAYGIGYLPQESSIFCGLNVYNNIMAILEFVESDLEIRINRIEELLNDFGISHLKYAESSSLSGGERRRLEIARAIAMNPRFIMLDEPLAGVDPLAVEEIKKLIIKLKSKNIGVLLTDHNARDALDIVDRAYVIYDGKILFNGTKEEVINSNLVKEVYLGKSFDGYIVI